MRVLVVQVRAVLVDVCQCLVPVGVTVLAEEGRVMHVVMVTVIVAVGMLMLLCLVHVLMCVLLSHVQVDRDGEEQRSDSDKEAALPVAKRECHSCA